MKTMKNVLMILLGAALVLSLAGVGAVAAAGEITKGTEQSSNFQVTYTIGDSYSITVPVSVVLTEGQEQYVTQKIGVTAVVTYGKTLSIYVKSDQDWEMLINGKGAGTGIEYTMNYVDPSSGAPATVTKGQDKNRVCIYSTPSTVPNEDVTISFSLNADPSGDLDAGDYIDSLSFEVEYQDTNA